jgi:hypothetical protein
MSDLQNLQQQFQDFLFNEAAPFKLQVISTQRAPAETRLTIYSNAYRSRLTEVLADTFPALHRYLGDLEFTKLAQAYIANYPSTFRSIRWYGDNLANFLKNYPQQNAKLLSEIAQFEWAMSLAFDAADDSVLQLSDLAAIPPQHWADISFVPQPSLQQLNLTWNIGPLWQALTNPEANIAIEPIENVNSISWLVWRKQLINQYCSLPEDEAWAITAMMAQKTFGEICSGLTQWLSEEQAALRAGSLLKGWIVAGLIAKVQLAVL